MTITENGYGKRSDVSEYKVQNRNGKGIKAGIFNEKTGKPVYNYTVDKSLLGGMVIRVGDRVVDTSIQNKLKSLSKQLSALQVG